MTYGELREKLEHLTPDELEQPVRWVGEERGGKVDGLEALTEDQCNPSGDGWEPKSDVVKQEIEQGATEAAAKDFAESEVVFPVGTLFLVVDGMSLQ